MPVFEPWLIRRLMKLQPKQPGNAMGVPNVESINVVERDRSVRSPAMTDLRHGKISDWIGPLSNNTISGYRLQGLSSFGLGKLGDWT